METYIPGVLEWPSVQSDTYLVDTPRGLSLRGEGASPVRCPHREAGALTEPFSSFACGAPDGVGSLPVAPLGRADRGTMTTEIAILNKSAVALAADSAVTITTHRDGQPQSVAKIYVDANKLFELVKGRSVGVMIYNSANVAGVPWETLIKEYRTHNRGAAFATLEEYADDFIRFVGDALGPFLTERDEEAQVLDSVFPMADRVYGTMLPQFVGLPKKVDRRTKFAELLDDFAADLDGAALAEWASGISDDEVWSRWGTQIVDRLPDSTDEFGLTKVLKEKFARVLLRVLLRADEPFGAWSGLVIAGFGDSEMFPTVCHARVGGFLLGRLVKVQSEVESVTNETPALIKPYAQTSEALMFLQGIDPDVSSAVQAFWRRWTDGLQDDVVQIVDKESQVAPDNLSAIRKRLKSHFHTSWNAFANFMQEEFHQRRLEPIEASAGFLSKREIADLAENLVDLTSLRNRVSLDRQETVGGATDVAVISKGDGFVWVKRKHYFERDRNPAWGMRQALTDVLSSLQVPSEADKGQEDE